MRAGHTGKPQRNVIFVMFALRKRLMRGINLLPRNSPRPLLRLSPEEQADEIAENQSRRNAARGCRKAARQRAE